MASTESLKLNIDWAVRGKLGPPILFYFYNGRCWVHQLLKYFAILRGKLNSCPLSILGSRFRNEAEVRAILEVLQILSSASKDGLIVESDFSMLSCR